jgi:SpoVK/Ycf46/Vps4 family AAA+-type ATPase
MGRRIKFANAEPSPVSKLEKLLSNYAPEVQIDGVESIEDIGNEEKMSDLIEYEENSSYESFGITFIEFAIINEFLYDTLNGKNKQLTVSSFGSVDSLGRISYGGNFSITNSWWFQCNLDGQDIIFQTRVFLDRNDIITELQITTLKRTKYELLEKLKSRIINLAFNNSKYTGKCIKVKLREGHFKGIEIVEMNNYSTELILSETQNKFIEHFISRVGRGGTARYLLNGEPGTGKTESIREIIKRLTPNVTFIIPDFSSSEDLTVILEACEIFESGVIIMDDIDLYLGSRDRGNYTQLLGQFLSFFDGVKKRKISLLASTNDKGLVDKAAERPGRFNMTLDYTFLTEEQVISVCKIHLPVEYQIEDVYKTLNGSINGKKANITGAFIANLAENIKEMAEDSENWTIEDTISLIRESYRGFYASQVNKQTNLGFKVS